MAIRDGPHEGPTACSSTTLGEGASAANVCVPAEDGEKRSAREQHVARRSAVVEAHEHELQASQDAWWRSMSASLDHQLQCEDQTQESVATHREATEGWSRTGEAYQPAEENAYTLGDQDLHRARKSKATNRRPARHPSRLTRN